MLSIIDGLIERAIIVAVLSGALYLVVRLAQAGWALGGYVY